MPSDNPPVDSFYNEDFDSPSPSEIDFHENDSQRSQYSPGHPLSTTPLSDGSQALSTTPLSDGSPEELFRNSQLFSEGGCSPTPDPNLEPTHVSRTTVATMVHTPVSKINGELSPSYGVPATGHICADGQGDCEGEVIPTPSSSSYEKESGAKTFHLENTLAHMTESAQSRHTSASENCDRAHTSHSESRNSMGSRLSRLTYNANGGDSYEDDFDDDEVDCHEGLESDIVNEASISLPQTYTNHEESISSEGYTKRNSRISGRSGKTGKLDSSGVRSRSILTVSGRPVDYCV